MTTGVLSVALMTVFQLIKCCLCMDRCRAVRAPYLWIELKVINNVLMSAVVGSLIMFQYTAAMLGLYAMVVLRFSSCLAPVRDSYDFSWKNYIISVLRTLAWLATTLGGGSLLLFGTILEHHKYDMESLAARSFDLA